MELDDKALKQEPFSQCRMMSAPAYVRTLRIPGNFDWRRAIHTILVHFRLYMLLPVADLIVRKHSTGGVQDPFEPVGGAPWTQPSLLFVGHASSCFITMSGLASARFLPAMAQCDGVECTCIWSSPALYITGSRNDIRAAPVC